MRQRRRRTVVTFAIGAVLAAGGLDGAAAAGRIVVVTDEWTLSDRGFAVAPDAARFVANVAAWFTGGAPGHFLGYSTNFGLNQPALAAAMAAAGHTWTVDPGLPFDLATLLRYDAVFLGLPTVVDPQVLIEYVRAGGSVYVMAGTGFRNGAVEAATWAPFLNEFGLAYEPFYHEDVGLTPLCALFAIDSRHPVLEGVRGLYFCNGNPVSRLDAADPRTEILFAVDGLGFVGVFRPSAAATVEAKVELAGERFEVKALVTLGPDSDGIAPQAEGLGLALRGGPGAFSTHVPPGAFVIDRKGRLKFEGVVEGVALEAVVRPLGGPRFEVKAEGRGAPLAGFVNPVTLTITLGDDVATAAVTAELE